MITRYTHRKITWIDLESPTREEVRMISEELGIPPLVSNELFTPTVRSKVDLYKNFIYLILHFPILNVSRGVTREQEVDFVIGKNIIVTTHYETVDTIHEFSRMFEVHSLIDKTELGTHAGFVFFYLARELYRSVTVELEGVGLELRQIENQIFTGRERDMVEVISVMHKQLLTFKQSLRLHEEVLASLELAGKHFFGDSFGYHLRAIQGEYAKAASQLEGHRETLAELRETNTALLSTKQNDIMKNLTVMTFMMLPLSLIAGIFSMETAHSPILGTPADFWFIVGIMLFFAGVIFLYFRYRKWF